ncbi:MAG: MFS transporter [Candidatus Hodarchaeales archaeon]
MKTTVNSQKNDLNSNNSVQYNLTGYISFWIGQLISLLGSNIVAFVIIWWIVIETDSEVFLALAAFFGFFPFIILTPIAGVFVDRWSRKKIIATVDFLQALATMVLIFLFIIELATIWVVLTILGIRAVMQSFHGPAVQAIVPLLVSPERLSRMNGLDYLFNGVIMLLGPLVAAILLIWWSITEILWLDAITFFIAVIPMILIKIPSIKKEKVDSQIEKASFRSEFLEGIHFISYKKGLLALLSVFTAANFFLQPFFILVPLFITRIHNGGAPELALLLSAQQAGLILGSVLMSMKEIFKNNAHGVGLGIFGMYLGLSLIIITPYNFIPMLVIGGFILGFCLPVANVSSQTIWQKIVPPEKMGRVFSVRQTIAQISAPVAMIITGLIAGFTGIIPLIELCVILGLIVLGYSWFFTGFRYVERPSQIGEPITTIQTEISDQIIH